MPPCNPDDHPHSDLTRSIIESAIHVQNALGVGLLEKSYKFCLAHALRKKGHRVLLEVSLDIIFEGLEVVDSFRIDLLVDDTAAGPQSRSEAILKVFNPPTAQAWRPWLGSPCQGFRHGWRSI
jgi:hypothetical protein